MNMHEVATFVMGLSGPVPHALFFGTIAFIIGWFTKEIRATMILVIIISIGGECLQLAWPDQFDFDVTDIWWNMIGSAGGILLAQLGHLLSSELWIKREKGWDSIKGELDRGNYTR